MRDYLYAQLYDPITGKHIDHYRTLGKQYEVGEVFKRSCREGHIPFRVVAVENTTYDTGDKYQKLFVEEGAYVQEYCRHEWDARPSAKLSTHIAYERKCTKCGKREEFDYGKAKWV